MAKFRYKRGERPLDGYTIEHGLGVGGFGEVYFAVSDAGREVALKALQNYQDIELRGIRNCMNLKSPHLVSVFDVRYNDDEEPFVIMEYVQGLSLRQLLDGSPEGLGEAKAAFFLREMAKGLTYLHEAGVVHRDLKPHNVFYEDGFVKIGDYSLCKMMSASHRTGHTMTVGTVHYMAPEIGEGRYDASVDIYALGIMLYEMLTGTPPYTGDSLGEVLMKHMTAEPKLDKLAEPYRTVVAKALSKNPEDRYATPADMVEAVFGAEHVQNSVVEFNPQELTIVANMATKRAFTTPSGRPASSRPGGASWGKTWTPGQDNDSTGSESGRTTSPPPPVPETDERDDEREPEFSRQSVWPPQPAPKPSHTANVTATAKPKGLATKNKDPMPLVLRLGLAVVSAVALAFFADRTSHAWDTGEVFPGIATMILCGAGAALLSRLPLRYFSLENSILNRSFLGAAIALTILTLGIVFDFLLEYDILAAMLPGVGLVLPFLLFGWDKHIANNRTRRVDGWLLLRTALLSFIGVKVAILMGDDYVWWIPNVSMLGAITTFGIGLCLQLVSPRYAPLSKPMDQRAAFASTSADGALRKEHVAPVHDAEPAYVASAAPQTAAAAKGGPQYSPAAPRRSRPSDPTFDEKLEKARFIGKIICGAVGIVLFAASCVLSILALTMHGPFMTLSIVGFGLTVGAFGFLVGSGGWQGGAFGRMFAACMMLSWMHISAFSGELPEPVVAMALPVAAALLAWPRSEKKQLNQKVKNRRNE